MQRCSFATVDVAGAIRLAGLLCALLPAAAVAQFTEEELARRPELERFLAEAEIIASEQMPKSEGVTEPYKLTLREGDVERPALWKNPSGRMGGFWEGWQYEIAAYLLDKHLGVDMVPPTVERTFEGNRGSIQLWVEPVMSGRQKLEDEVPVPGRFLPNWNRMTYLQRAFDNYIGNRDRHMGNILILEDWRVCLIDHSRSFATGKRYTRRLIDDPEDKPMTQLPRDFVARLRETDADTLRQVVGDYLKAEEIEAVMARRALLLDYVDEQIESRGESAALWDRE